jgi:hypothetical protein
LGGETGAAIGGPPAARRGKVPAAAELEAF